jgi:hypothetical protein
VVGGSGRVVGGWWEGGGRSVGGWEENGRRAHEERREEDESSQVRAALTTTAGKTKVKTCVKSHLVPSVECGPASHWPERAGEYESVS